MRELSEMAHKVARKISEEPTGVEPGYHAALGGTVRPDGRVSYVGVASSFMAAFAWELDNGAVANGSSYTRLQFSEYYQYDPVSSIVPGSSWHYTIPSSGVYAFFVRLDVAIPGSWDSTCQMDLRLHIPTLTPVDGDYAVSSQFGGTALTTGHNVGLTAFGAHVCKGGANFYTEFRHTGGAGSITLDGNLMIFRF